MAYGGFGRIRSIADKDERAKLGDAAAAINAHRHADAGIELPTPRAWSY